MPTNDVILAPANANGVQGGNDALTGSLQNFGAALGAALPDIIAAILILIIGIILANVLGNVARRLVIWSRLDHLIRRSPAQGKEMNETAMKFRAADAVGALVKWLIILFAIAIAANMLGWTQITQLVNGLIAYIPNIAAAILLVVGGYLLGNFAGSLVSGMGTTLGRAAGVLGDVTRWAIFIFAAMAALIQLGIAESIIMIVFSGLMGMVALAGGLAFGLGGRDKARDLLSNVGSSTGEPQHAS